MLLSVFTPTHNTTFIEEAYDSLRLQDYTNWEWLIALNGEATTVPDKVKRDKRVKLLDGARQLHNVGALKRFTCERASGDVFVELDHDDLLIPGKSLSSIVDCVKKGAGFVYSDTAVFRYSEDNSGKHYKDFTYSSQHGWEHYPVKVYGRTLKANKCFEVSPRSLAEIYYAPDHVRCWTRAAYYEAGGHNPDLPVCDDHELMIKTYLSGSKFMHTGGCNYLYRMYKGNTVEHRNKIIQEHTQQFNRQYIGELIKEWKKRNSYDDLNITTLLAKGWSVERDLLKGFGADQYGHITADMELQKWEPWQVREFMNEAYEALIPGGYLSLIVPDSLSAAGNIDVEWKTKFGYYSMFPYTRSDYARINGNINCRFQVAGANIVFASDWHRDNDVKYFKFDLCALKGQHHPALQHI